ncbi:MAG: PhnD/SsuA/transferrin family substrate-binding protein [Woeseiaceae bacterium]
MRLFNPIYIIILVFSLSSFSLYADEIRIAVRANKGEAKALSKWQATADHLSEKLPQHHFTIVPFENNSALNQAISRGNYDFCITNPASGVEHKVRYQAVPLATLVNKRQGKGYSNFGSVIFTRSDRSDVNTFEDLKGKMFVAVDELGFGGWRVAWYELLQNNINPFTDFSELHFAGGKQQNVVFEVRDKIVAAGSVRTDTLERMAAEGKINLNDYKVIGQRKTEKFPFLHSTKLYPEWMFSAENSVDSDFKNEVIKALFSIQKNDKAAKNGKYVQWIPPVDYTPVDDLLKELKVGPYNIATMSPFQRLTSQYGGISIVAIVIISVLSFAFLYLLKLNRQILIAKDELKTEAVARSNLERKLLHSQRIESLGQLTGGIAHDFNNMLASILGFTELALSSKTVGKDEKIKGYLELVILSTNKCSDLVTQMLAFSKTAGDTDKKETIAVVSLVDDFYELLNSIVPSNFSLSVTRIDESLNVNVNPIMMSQVMMNLYLNSKDAITKEQGVITLGAELVHYDALDSFCDSCHQNIRGDYVAIYIRDNGFGISSDKKDHLFDPFFTTKQVGKGTGMGLSMVHGYIHKQAGHIIVESIDSPLKNQGTIVKLLIPLDEQKNAVIPKEIITLDPVGTSANGEHILVVDDELSLTIYLSELLRSKGYNVTSFNCSNKALSFYKGHHNDIDLVISDQTMPILTGIEMTKEIRMINATVPMIICSGYSEGIQEKIEAFDNVDFISKPIHANVLLEMINQQITTAQNK